MKANIMILVLMILVATTSPILYSSNNIIVGVYFYPWYSITEHRHWDNTVRDKPYIGYYDSYNESVIRWQLKLIKDAGIDFIVFSWWGPSSFEDNTTKVIVKYLREYGLRFAIMIEPYLGNEHPEYYNKTFWEKTLNYIKTNYIEPYNGIYFYLNGKPLVLTFNPIGMDYNPSQDFLNYTIRITGNDIDNAGYQDWDYWPDYIDPSNIELRIRRDGYVVITPRYDDTHFRSPGTCIDQNYTLGLYQREWEWILEHKDKINIVMITSWNEYHERTMIEPHYDDTAKVDPFYIYNLTARYIDELKKSRSSYYIIDEIVSLSSSILATGAALIVFGLFSRFLYRVIKF